MNKKPYELAEFFQSAGNVPDERGELKTNESGEDQQILSIVAETYENVEKGKMAKMKADEIFRSATLKVFRTRNERRRKMMN